MDEAAAIDRLFAELVSAPLERYPARGERIAAPDAGGVYILSLDVNGSVLHVGRTTQAPDGVRQRLSNDVRGHSPFARAYPTLDVRGECLFRYLVVPDPRTRILLQALAIGRLCPQFLGGRGSG